MQISQRAQSTPSSPIRKFAKYEQAARDRGISVLKLNIGQPDLHTPKPIRKAFRKFKHDIVLYAPSQGLPETIDAWRTYYKSHGHTLEKDEVMVTSGGSEAILFSLLATCDPGDEVIIFEPFYTNFAGFAAMADVTLVPITLDFNDGFALPSIEVMKSKITEKTKAIIVNNPNNPTGVVYGKEQMQQLVNIAYKHDLYLISDEVYREFIFDDSVHASLLHYPEVEDKVIVIDSVSKRFNHCGGRVGCLISRNKDIMNSVLKFGQARLSVPTLEQMSVIPLLTRPREYTNSVKKEYMKRREIVVEGLKSIEGVSFVQPQGSFYVIAQLPIQNAEDFVQFLLEEFEDDSQTVMVSPAAGFYTTPGLGTNQIRIAFVLDEPELERAMQLLQKGLEAFKNK